VIPPVPCCPHCGAETPDTLTLGDLAVSYNPPETLWKGKRLNISPAESRQLYTMMRRGRASYDALAILPSGEYCGTDVVRTRICKIRRKFAEAGVPIVIESVREYGYKIGLAA
jgi:DNA-binding response OmpR family regulator